MPPQSPPSSADRERAAALQARAAELLAGGDLDGALASAEAAVGADPGSAEARNLLGNVLVRRGDDEAATAAYRAAIDRDPALFKPYGNLGVLAAKRGAHEEAAGLYHQAIERSPRSFRFRTNLGNALRDLGRTTEAIEAYRASLAIEESVPALSNLGALLVAEGDVAGAIPILEKLIAVRPDDHRARFALGLARLRTGDEGAADDHFTRATLLCPPGELVALAHDLARERRPAILAALARLARETSDAAAAGACFADPEVVRAVIAGARGDRASAHFLSNALAAPASKLVGEDAPALADILAAHASPAEAAVALRRVLERAASRSVSTSVLRAALDLADETPTLSTREIFALAARWAETLPTVAPARFAPAGGDRLRIGYVASRAFGESESGTLGFLASHDRKRFQIFGYGHGTPGPVGDPRRAVEFWRDIGSLDDARAADLVAADALDVLVVAEDHALDSRIEIARRLPAPIQLAWSPRHRTLGLPEVGFRVTDERSEPPGEADRWSTERLVRLPAASNDAGAPASGDAFVRGLERIYVDLARAYGPPEATRRARLAAPGGEFDPLDRASALLDERRPGEALDVALSALETNPDRLGAPELVMRAAAEATFDDRAASALAAVAQRSPAPHWSLLVATRLLALRDYPRAYAVGARSHDRFPEIEELAIVAARAAFELERFDETERYLARISGEWRSSSTAHSLRAQVALLLGDYAAARAHYRAGVEAAPDDASLASDYLFSSTYDPTVSPEALTEMHRGWARRHAPPREPRVVSDPRPDRRLRVGFVSPDLKIHPVACFIIPLLEAFDRERISISAYSTSLAHDAATARIRKATETFREVAGLSEVDLARTIADDRIDILVDLAGHTGGRRLTTFARGPAPIQVTYLGYPNTTGVPAMDYRLTDAVADPPGAERLCTEELVRLPGSAWVYRPLADHPRLAPSRRTAITFGSFNNVYKITDDVLALWARIVGARPGATLLLKTRAFSWAKARERTFARLEAAGLPRARVRLDPSAPGFSEHLGRYADVDVALDPFPYSGTTTTCDALWMGIPVVSLRGERHSSRVGASLLTSVGLERCIAATPDQYVEIALELARDAELRASLRATLRDRFLDSALGRPGDLARGMEDAFRAMWRRLLAAPS